MSLYIYIYMTVIFILAILSIIFGIGSALCIKGYKVTVRFTDSKSGRTLHVGNGDSIGNALVDGFSKMHDRLSINSKADTIISKLDTMRHALNENRSRMTKCDIERCEYYISSTQNLLLNKQADEKRKQENKKRDAERRAEQRQLLKQSQALARIEQANSLPAILTALEKARAFQNGSSTVSGTNFPVGEEEYLAVNAYIDKAFASIDKLAEQYVPLSEIKRKVAALENSVTKCSERLPLNSKLHYRDKITKLRGEDATHG